MEERELGAGEVRVEGVCARMPDISVYCYAADPELLDGVSVSYGGKELCVTESLPYAQAGEGTDYYMLIDISASVGKEYFACIKEGVLDFFHGMGERDRLTLISFGDKTRVVFQDAGSEDDIEETVRAMENTDQTTCLFDAVQKTAELADQMQTADIRKIALVWTDGEDFSENTSTKEEALFTLTEKGIPLYAMAARETARGDENAYLEGMGEFVRETGGRMEIFDTGDAAEKIKGLREMFGEAYVIRAKAENNLVDYEEKLLAVTFSDGKTQTAEYRATYYQKDETPPSAEAEKISAKEIKVTFSEPVSGAGETSAYDISLEGDTFAGVYAAHYQEDGGKAFANLSFQEELLNGTYEITFHGITDVSMEKNSLESSCGVTVTDGKTFGIRDYLMQYQAAIAGGSVLIVLLAVFFAVFRILGKRKGVVTIEGKAVLGANVEKKHHVAIKKTKLSGRQIILSLEGTMLGRQEIPVMVAGSIIVGRSKICDVSIEDEQMSRQHFAISDKDGAFYIEDLHTTNGTVLNGKRISRDELLSSGDRIQVGEITMMARW